MPPDIWYAVEIGAIAFFAGAFGAMVGIGGGLFLVPALISFFGVGTAEARGASLVAVCVTSIAGSLVYLRKDLVDFFRASYLQLPTSVGALLGAFMGGALDETVVRLLFACFLLYVTFRLWIPEQQEFQQTSRSLSWKAAILACLAGGIISSLLGVGGGIIFVPVLVLLFNLTPQRAAATSTYLIGLTAAASGLIYQQMGHMNPKIVIPCVLGILMGAMIGARTAPKVPAVLLRRTFSVVTFLSALILLDKVIRSYWTGA